MKWGSSDTVRGTGTGRRETGDSLREETTSESEGDRSSKTSCGRDSGILGRTWSGLGPLPRRPPVPKCWPQYQRSLLSHYVSAADKPIPLATYEYMFRQRDAFFFLWGSEGEGKGSKGKMAGDEAEVGVLHQDPLVWTT